MALSRVGGDTFELNNASSGALTWPGGLSANHFAVISINWYENNNKYLSAAPTDFDLRNTSGGDVYENQGGTSYESRVLVYTKSLAGTESGDLTISFSGNVYATATLDVFAGDSDLTYASISSVSTGQSSDAVAPSVSGTSGQGLVVVYALNDPPGTTNSAPAGMTLGSEQHDATMGSRTYYQTLSATEATGTRTWDFTDTEYWAAFSLLIDGAGAETSGGGITLSQVERRSMTRGLARGLS